METSGWPLGWPLVGVLTAIAIWVWWGTLERRRHGPLRARKPAPTPAAVPAPVAADTQAVRRRHTEACRTSAIYGGRYNCELMCPPEVPDPYRTAVCPHCGKAI